MGEATYTRHVSLGGDFAVALPQEWEAIDGQELQAAFIGIAPRSPELPEGMPEFRTNVVVSVDEVSQDSTLQAWQEEVDRLLPELLSDYLLLDLEVVEVGGHQALRRLCCHAGSGGDSVTTEQWALLVDRRGYTLSASVASLEFARWARDLAGIAETLHVQGDPDGRTQS